MNMLILDICIKEQKEKNACSICFNECYDDNVEWIY